MLDPATDPARRVWAACTPCGSTAGLYLLATEPRLVFVQCGQCYARYWLDTRCGAGRPEYVTTELPWPA